MSDAPRHTEPSHDAIQEAVRVALADALAKIYAGDALQPWQTYSAEEAAAILGIGTKTVYDIPEVELPRCRVGPNRGSVRFLGADLLCYLRGEEPLDFAGALHDAFDNLRSQLTRSPTEPAVRPLPGSGKTRVL